MLGNLPESLCRLSNLQHLEFGSLVSLQKLDLPDAWLQSLPPRFGSLTNLQQLDLPGCLDIIDLPSSFGGLCSLHQLSLRSCKMLQSLPPSFGSLTKLQLLDLTSCERLRSLPNSFGGLIGLRHLHIDEALADQIPVALTSSSECTIERYCSEDNSDEEY